MASSLSAEEIIKHFMDIYLAHNLSFTDDASVDPSAIILRILDAISSEQSSFCIDSK